MSTYAGSADNGAIDLEYTPQPGRKICAADARHEELRAQLDDALIRIEQLEESMGRMQIVGGNRRPAPHRERRQPSVNEAIGTLQYNLEQHIEKCADGLAPLAGFITSSWAVIDELEARIAKLEEAQPKPVPDNYAHIPIAEWLDFKEELEALRAKWENVPWEQINAMRMALAQVFRDKLVQWPSTQRAMFDVEKWLGENMPKEAAE